MLRGGCSFINKNPLPPPPPPPAAAIGAAAATAANAKKGRFGAMVAAKKRAVSTGAAPAGPAMKKPDKKGPDKKEPAKKKPEKKAPEKKEPAVDPQQAEAAAPDTASFSANASSAANSPRDWQPVRASDATTDSGILACLFRPKVEVVVKKEPRPSRAPVPSHAWSVAPSMAPSTPAPSMAPSAAPSTPVEPMLEWSAHPSSIGRSFGGPLIHTGNVGSAIAGYIGNSGMSAASQPESGAYTKAIWAAGQAADKVDALEAERVADAAEAAAAERVADAAASAAGGQVAEVDDSPNDDDEDPDDEDDDAPLSVVSLPASAAHCDCAAHMSSSDALATASLKALTADKALYNKFYYRLQKVPELLEDWDKIRHSNDEAGFNELRATLFAHKPGKVPKDAIAKVKKVENYEDNFDEGGWVPWRRACELEGGHDLLLEMVECGNVKTKRNKKLPAASTVPYPLNQVCRHVEERFRTGRMQTNTCARDEDTSLRDVVDFNAGEVITVDVAASLAGQAAHQKNAGGDEPRTHEELVKAANGHISKAHSAFDSAKRDFNAVLAQARAHRNTRGTQVIQDLEALVQLSEKHDAKLIRTEANIKTGSTITRAVVLQCASAAIALGTLLKDGRKKSAALRTIMKA